MKKLIKYIRMTWYFMFNKNVTKVCKTCCNHYDCPEICETTVMDWRDA